MLIYRIILLWYVWGIIATAVVLTVWAITKAKNKKKTVRGNIHLAMSGAYTLQKKLVREPKVHVQIHTNGAAGCSHGAGMGGAGGGCGAGGASIMHPMSTPYEPFAGGFSLFGHTVVYNSTVPATKTNFVIPDHLVSKNITIKKGDPPGDGGGGGAPYRRGWLRSGSVYRRFDDGKWRKI